MNNRAGKFISNLSGEAEYESFCPNPLPPVPAIDTDSEMEKLLIEANKKVALLEGLSSRIPNMELFISMYIRKEALVSSQMEGTQCTLEDVLDPNIDENTNLDVGDVINYIRAFEFAIKRLEELPLCNRLLKEIHAVLMQGVRGGDKTPGEFRTSQNWIGGTGSTIKNARFIPPNPSDMLEAMSDLEKYINSEDELDALIRAALIHYQFETIHPFLDGNGRVGRLLIILYLIQEKLLSTPVLYISCLLKINQIEYYDRMTEIRNKGNYEQWIKFFLTVVAQTADDAVETIDKLTALHISSVAKLDGIPSRSKNKVDQLFAYIEKNPIIDTQKTADALGFAYNTTAKYIDVLCEKGILKQTAKAGKAKVYSYEEYLSILRNNTI
ncbi:MAG: Fic family protein [Ruminococcaceae bacterium]|nr:Fic family protein [Oscillospiraceae bacterium]